MRTLFFSLTLLVFTCGSLAAANTELGHVQTLFLSDGTSIDVPTVAYIAAQAATCESLKDHDYAVLCMSWIQDATEKSGAARNIVALMQQMGADDHSVLMFTSSTHAKTAAAEAMAKMKSLENMNGGAYAAASSR